MEEASPGLFCQLILVPLLARHRILAQVAGHGMPVIKLLPPLVVEQADVDWTLTGLEDVVRAAHRWARSGISAARSPATRSGPAARPEATNAKGRAHAPRCFTSRRRRCRIGSV